VTLIDAANGKLSFRLGDNEKSLLITMLELYPRVTSAATLARKPRRSAQDKDTETLLEEALAEQRRETKKQLKAFCLDPKHFQKQEAGWRMSVTETEADWLLQILNDIRVGSWIALGSPEESLEVLTKKNARDFWAMEIAGRFEAALLEALSGKRRG
jgi:hypothetical protein